MLPRLPGASHQDASHGPGFRLRKLPDKCPEFPQTIAHQLQRQEPPDGRERGRPRVQGTCAVSVAEVFKQENCLGCRGGWIGPKVHGGLVLCCKTACTKANVRLCGFCSMSWWQMPTASNIGKFGNRREFHISSHLRNIVNFVTSLESLSCSSKEVAPGHTILQLSDDDE